MACAAARLPLTTAIVPAYLLKFRKILVYPPQWDAAGWLLGTSLNLVGKVPTPSCLGLFFPPWCHQSLKGHTLCNVQINASLAPGKWRPAAYAVCPNAAGSWQPPRLELQRRDKDRGHQVPRHSPYSTHYQIHLQAVFFCFTAPPINSSASASLPPARHWKPRWWWFLGVLTLILPHQVWMTAASHWYNMSQRHAH